MSLEIAILFLIIIVVIILFALEVFPVDKIAFFILAALLLTNLVSPEEAISGFSSPATITVLALMIIAIGLETNGVIDWLASGLKNLRVLPVFLMVPVFMFIAGSISAFINTTAVVIVFIKIITELSARYDIPNSKLLLPISFAGIIGGSCTLMGTSTNLIVNAVAIDRGVERFGFFEFTWYGVIFMVITIVVVSSMIKFLPRSKKTKISEDYNLDEYITKVIIKSNSSAIGKSIGESFLSDEDDIEVLRLKRNGIINDWPGKFTTLKDGDQLLLRCNLENLLKLKDAEGFTVIKEEDNKKLADPIIDSEELEENVQVVEILMLPNSPLIGKSIKTVGWYDLHGAVPLAIRKRRNFRNPRRRIFNRGKDEIELRVGDRLLVEVSESALEELQKIENVTILQQHKNIEVTTVTKRYLSLGILLVVIGLSAFSIFPILKSAIIGCFLMIFTKCIDLGKIYEQVNWQIIFLLAGMIPLGVAMNNTGADQWISDQLLLVFENQTDTIIIGILFLVTMILSGFISNNATAIIITPIAISIAASMQMDPKPFILSVLFASNFSFFTPVGYQTNTIIYGMGIYRFRHFFIIGGLVSLVLWVTASLLLSASF
ncbi:SLC13 family permease [Salegentibacter mishustinae]|jgi:di/tricarboxylate transporter|uniref:Potassium transporter TrkA n=1 Tax=Salegentibacter mishustinae TaxID=270918 RepID=A0A0Q9ZEZ8_9FLAO|nr:SLC13 family permease [Salegentibacter mishustinae]KRG27175.1 potassium transporter TrkA [Salegentibacter mishustinae]MDX1427492.1 SLC13 family permease [Salegentibacter mishustinae]PNW21409.1 potassium transporter TrkA [Salegentibacter mishustinae]PZX62645.1 di/tricarboxylate transporter [Salegentibacter mishustinae]GGW97279.1 membrane protein [Salegentibacter mishustinae]|tara:strand:+ start:743 stop:2554 length:1812 start_codon:yes stop_codon:yes gene_type:complete